MEPTRWTDSPYVSICIRPRATIRAIVDSDPRDQVIALVLVTTAIVVLTKEIHGYGYDPTAFAIAGKPIPEWAHHTLRLAKLWGFAIAILLAVPLLFINGALFRWIGSQLGGKAKAVEVRAAIGWRSVPSIIMILAQLRNWVSGAAALPARGAGFDQFGTGDLAIDVAVHDYFVPAVAVVVHRMARVSQRSASILGMAGASDLA